MPKTLALEDLYTQLQLDGDYQKALVDNLVTQVRNAKADRKELEDRWDRAYALFEGRRPPKDRPWKNASNVHIPLVSTHASAIHARFMTAAFTYDPFWRVKARRPDYVDFADSATEYMDWSRQNEFELYEPIRDATWDSVKVGLGVLKPTWRRRKGKELRYERDEKGGPLRIVEDEVDVEDRPHVESIKPHNFLWTPGHDNIQTCPWVCHVIKLTAAQIRKGQLDGTYRKTPGIKFVPTMTSEPLDLQHQEIEGIFPSDPDQLDVYEIWARTPIKLDGPEQEIRLLVEPDTGAVLSITPLPFFHRKRPFIVLRLETREHSIVGLGVADMVGDLNEELNTIHNQMVDATTASIVQMYGVRAGSPTEAALDEIWPSKKIPAASKDDVWPINLGPLTVNSLPLEEYVRSYAERRTGISDFGLGREPSSSRRGTATGTLAIIQEGNKKFDYQVRDMREGVAEVGEMILSMMQQMYPEGKIQQVLGEDGKSFRTISLSFPDVPLNHAVTVEVEASSATANKQMQRQDLMTQFQIMTTVYNIAWQFGQQIAIPGLPPPLYQLATEVGHGVEVFMRDVLKAFENRKADDLIPDLEEIYAQIGAGSIAQTVQMMQMGGMNGQVAGGGGPQGPAGTPGVPPSGGGTPQAGQNSGASPTNRGPNPATP